MIVSQFQVSIYPNATQRFQLFLTDLGTERYRFRLTFHTHTSYEMGQQWHTSWNSSYTSSYVAIERVGKQAFAGAGLLNPRPHDTATITLVPNNPEEHSDISGYVELSLPLVLDEGNQMRPQGDEPVPVLLHAFALRGPEFEPVPMTLSTGKALNEIMPDQGITLPDWGLVLPGVQDDAAAGEEGSAAREGISRDYAALFEDPLAVTAAVAYLGLAAETPKSVEALNGLLQRAGYSVRLTRSRRRQ